MTHVTKGLPRNPALTINSARMLLVPLLAHCLVDEFSDYIRGVSTASSAIHPLPGRQFHLSLLTKMQESGGITG